MTKYVIKGSLYSIPLRSVFFHVVVVVVVTGRMSWGKKERSFSLSRLGVSRQVLRE